MTQRVAIDTNVVLAALISIDPESPVARILDGMLAAAFTFVLSERRPAVRPALTLVTGDRLPLEDSVMAGRMIAPSTFVRDRHHSGGRP